MEKKSKGPRNSGELNQKQIGRSSDKVPQEGKNGDSSSQVNRSYKKSETERQSNQT